MFFYDENIKKITARLPVNKGVVSVGMHLPFGKEGQTEASIEEVYSGHVQIAQLPFRYQFPYFTDRKSSSFDGVHSRYIFNTSLRELIGYSDDKRNWRKESRRIR